MDEDEITDLADRVLAKQRRGENPEFEFAIEFGSLTDAEQDQLVALLKGRAAQGQELLEGLQENIRILCAIDTLIESSGAPPGSTLWEAGGAGYITLLEVVESISAVPDPLAGQKSD